MRGKEYAYGIVEAGSARCTLANRLKGHLRYASPSRGRLRFKFTTPWSCPKFSVAVAAPSLTIGRFHTA